MIRRPLTGSFLASVTNTKQMQNIILYYYPVLRDVFHWLPVRQRILYKVAAAAFNCIRSTGPAYFKHVCTLTSDISGRAHLRSAERRDMLVPRTRTELG